MELIMLEFKRYKSVIGKNIIFKEVQVSDASFILSLRINEKKSRYIRSLRINEKKSRYISKVENDLVKQEDWIKNYLKNNDSIYFLIVQKCDNRPIGTVRLYDQLSNSFNWGSWIIIDGVSPMFSIESALMVYKLGLKLGFNAAHFEVDKNNYSVQKFHENFGAQKISEDDRQFFYTITQEAILKSFQRYSRFIPSSIKFE